MNGRSVGLIALFMAAIFWGITAMGCSVLSDRVPGDIGEAGDRASQASKTGESAGGVQDTVDPNDPNDPVAIGPGGDSSDINRRYRNRPGRCKSASNWNEQVVGTSDGGESAAGISGGEADPNEVFQSIFNSRMDETPTPRQYLVRVMCGTGVWGVDSWLEERPYMTNYTYNEYPHIRLARYLDEQGGESEDLNILYRTVTAHHCWANSQWNVEKAYLPYLQCRRISEDLASPEVVGEAFDRLYPGHAYERQNIVYMAEQAHEARRELSAAYDSVEQEVAGLERLRKAMYEAMTEREEMRRQLAELFAIVDPITDLLVDSLDNRAPSDCKETLLDARAKLAQELFGGPPSDSDELTTLIAGHPLGYQITEALVYCHLDQGRTAQAKVAHDALQQGSRRSTAEEVAFLAVYGELNAIKQEEGRDDVLGGYVPTEIQHVYHMVRPHTMAVFQRMDYEIPAIDRFRTVGDTAEQPAVVAELEPTDEGVRVIFEEFSETIHYRERECFETDRIVRFDQRGDSIYPVYERQCHPVGDVKTRTVTHQADPVVLPEDEAERIEIGQQIRVLYNRLHDADAALLHMFEPGEERDSGSIVDGIDMASN